MLLALALIIKGLTAILIQTIFIRELLVLFSGNELTLGIILGSWILFQAVGAGIISRKKLPDNYFFFSLFQSFIVIISFFSLILLRNSRLILDKLPGESFSLIGISLISVFILAPFCIFDGWLFKLGSSVITDKNHAHKGVSFAYALEALGVIIGTAIFFVFIKEQIMVINQIFILAIFNLASALLLALKYQKCSIKRFLFFLSSILLITFFLVSLKTNYTGEYLSKRSLGNLFFGLEIIENKNSKYSNICVGKKDNQKTLFVNGRPVATFPYDNTGFNENFSHLALLEHNNPKNILLIGNYYGLINEIVKHDVKKINYLEHDAILVESFKNLSKDELENPVVDITITDPRNFIKHSTQKFDIVFINYGASSNLNTNRFYTYEFFTLIKHALKDNAVIALTCQGTESSYSEELKNINIHLLNTLKKSFNYLKVIPGENNIILASETMINLRPDHLFYNLKKRNIQTSFFNKQYLELLLDNSRNRWFWDSLKNNDLKYNLDLKPILVLDNLSFYSAKSFLKHKSIYSWINKINPFNIFTLLLIVLSVCIIISRKRKYFFLEYIAASTAFSEMLLILSILIAMQVYFGVIYSKIIIITTSFMAGLSLGTLVGYKISIRKNNLILIKTCETGFILLSVLILILFKKSLLLNEFILYLIASAIGIAHGIEFPAVNKTYLSAKPKNNIATIYTVELLGSFLAAVSTTILLIPILGIPNCIILVILIKLYSLVYLKLTRG